MIEPMLSSPTALSVAIGPTATPAPAVTEQIEVTSSELAATAALFTPEIAATAPTAGAPAAVITPDSTLPPTPRCSAGLPSTPPDMEGPYFLGNTPERASLIEPEMPGERLLLSGYVLSSGCEPMPGVQIEFWQADAAGEYDLQGYRLRGHLFTDENGRYQLETIIPGQYEPRPRHIHVKVLPPGSPGLTTQLYFPGESGSPQQTIQVTATEGVMLGEFDFILP